MAGEISGVGAQFLRWSGSVWVPMARVRSIAGPTRTRAFIDITSLDSTGGYREFISGFRDAGTVTLACVYTRDSYELFNSDFEDDVDKQYQIVLPDDDVSTLYFEGQVTELPLNIPTDDAVTFNVTIKITGQVTLESGSQAGV